MAAKNHSHRLRYNKFVQCQVSNVKARRLLQLSSPVGSGEATVNLLLLNTFRN